jgi:hypothetical protein
MRDYWGREANFQSGTARNNLRKGIHGAINDEMDEAMSLANPGMGDAWRQSGRDLESGIALEEAARKSANAARVAGNNSSANASMFGTAKKALYDSWAPGAKEAGYGMASGAAQRGSQLGSLLQRTPSTTAGVFGSSATPEPPKLDQAALDALYGGGSELGQYKSQFAEAAGSPNPGAVQDLITRLTLTDPQFRTQLLPLLSRRAGGM